MGRVKKRGIAADEKSQKETQKKEEILEKNEKKGKMEEMSEHLTHGLRCLVRRIAVRV
jgi:hypothetical protein